jgi:hypothetical protein
MTIDTAESELSTDHYPAGFGRFGPKPEKKRE